MAKAKKIHSKTKVKQLRASIATRLAEAFSSLKKMVGDKKFEKNIRKASKVLAAGAAAKVKPVSAAKKKVAA